MLDEPLTSPPESPSGGFQSTTSIGSSNVILPTPVRAVKSVPARVGGSVTMIVRVKGTCEPWRSQSVSLSQVSAAGKWVR